MVVIISDDFSGLTEAVKALYPLTEHQLCYIHLQHNVRRHMGKEDADEGKAKFENLCQQYKSNYLTFIKFYTQTQDS